MLQVWQQNASILTCFLSQSALRCDLISLKKRRFLIQNKSKMEDNIMNKIIKNRSVRKQLPEYTHNPSVQVAAENPKLSKRKVSSDGTQCLMFPETGEIQTAAPVVLHKVVEKDTEQFVKLFPAFVKSVETLSAPADKVFKMVYMEVLSNPNKDVIALHHKQAVGMSKATFDRGLTELLEKQILFKCVIPSQYYININYMFNGNRLAVVTEYRLKGEYYQDQLPGIQ
jgi:hypothetical protein